LTRKEKAQWIGSRLNELYPKPDIPLKHQDPYTLLVSVLLSAQCTDKKVNEISPLLFDLASDAFKMQKLGVDQIENIIRPCGLAPAKSRAIAGLSEILVEKYAGEVPKSMEKLEELPGVGHKTASVVMIQAFDSPAFPVDTHIHRLAYRWGLSNGKNVSQTEKDLKSLFARESWARLHLQIIYLGREYCPARGHRYTECPICSKLGVKSRM
jgi:endonuclease III